MMKSMVISTESYLNCSALYFHHSKNIGTEAEKLGVCAACKSGPEGSPLGCSLLK